MKNNIVQKYNLPLRVKFCSQCTISNQRPRISFDEYGVCSACRYSEHKKNVINWNQREYELEKLCDSHRKSNGDFDVIVPCSGGKDGSYVAHQLKNKYDMNPLTVTWSPLKASEIGKRNLQNFINSGFSHIMGTADPNLTKRLATLSFIHLGDPFQPFIYGQTNFPIQMALKYNIQLVMYGENGEVEYGGDMTDAGSPIRKFQDSNKIYFSGLPPEFWERHGVERKDLKPFMLPKLSHIAKAGIERHFFGYYKYWDPQENFYYSQKYTGFSPDSRRTDGTYSKYASIDDEIDGFHYYLSYIKFGLGRATSDSAHEIRDNKIDRDEGIALVKKYDHEFPNRYYKEFLEYCDLSEEEVTNIIDSWRSDHLWHKKNDQWCLRNQLES